MKPLAFGFILATVGCYKGLTVSWGHAGRRPRYDTSCSHFLCSHHHRRHVSHQGRALFLGQDLLMAPLLHRTHGSPAIEFDSVHIGFDEGEILSGVSFRVMPRETLILLGETGTGKTLSLKLAAGLLKANSGFIRVLGKDLGAMSERELLASAAKSVSFFQEGALFDSMTVADNVAYRLSKTAPIPMKSNRTSAKFSASSSSSTPWISFLPNSPAVCAAAFPSPRAHHASAHRPLRFADGRSRSRHLATIITLHLASPRYLRRHRAPRHARVQDGFALAKFSFRQIFQSRGTQLENGATNHGATTRSSSSATAKPISKRA